MISLTDFASGGRKRGDSACLAWHHSRLVEPLALAEEGGLAFGIDDTDRAIVLRAPGQLGVDAHHHVEQRMPAPRP